MLRRSREVDLKDEAMQAARLKCHVQANKFAKCSFDNPFKESTFCVNEFNDMKTCFIQENEVEMDKRRRDVTRNNE